MTIRPPRNPASELEKLEKPSAIDLLPSIESDHKIDFDNIEIIQEKHFRNHKERLIASEVLHIKWNPNCLMNRNDALK
ncbi:unnamed protein product [Trichobilharzia regenti]|nr:unnamed protein product [Trichobilharzia regenti]